MSTSAPERLALPRHPELLSPAGGPEAFAAAIAAGADAIYCGMGTFNARRKATNFTDEAFEAAWTDLQMAVESAGLETYAQYRAENYQHNLELMAE